jgi:hypothetical protein
MTGWRPYAIWWVLSTGGLKAVDAIGAAPAIVAAWFVYGVLGAGFAVGLLWLFLWVVWCLAGCYEEPDVLLRD